MTVGKAIPLKNGLLVIVAFILFAPGAAFPNTGRLNGHFAGGPAKADVRKRAKAAR